MKYLKFIKQTKLNQIEGAKIDFNFIISDKLENVIHPNNNEVKSISVGLSGRELSSLSAHYRKYEPGQILFEIANNYLIERISYGDEIKEKEELLLGAWEYLTSDSKILTGYNSKVFEIEC